MKSGKLFHAEQVLGTKKWKNALVWAKGWW